MEDRRRDISTYQDGYSSPEVAIDLVTCRSKKSCLNKRFACLKNCFKFTDACNWIVKIRTKDLNQYPLMRSFKTIILMTNSSV